MTSKIKFPSLVSNPNSSGTQFATSMSCLNLLTLMSLPSVKSSWNFLIALSLPRNEPNSVWLISKLKTLGDPAVPCSYCLLGTVSWFTLSLGEVGGRGATGCGLSAASQTILLRQVWAFPQMLVKASQSLRDRVVTGQGSVHICFWSPEHNRWT